MNEITPFEGFKPRIDSEGRLNLNDLHRLSGGLDKHKPSNYLKLKRTQGLIAEISGKLGGDAIPSAPESIEPIKTINGGNDAGTWTMKPIVYDYAMWISPLFNLKVIEFYDKNKDQKKIENLTPIQMLLKEAQALAELEQQQLVLIELQKQHDSRIRQQETKIEVLAKEVSNFTHDFEYFTVAAYAKRLGYNIDESQAKELGRVISKHCRTNKIHVGKLNHPKYGSVNTYHKDLFEKLFSHYKKEDKL